MRRGDINSMDSLFSRIIAIDLMSRQLNCMLTSLFTTFSLRQNCLKCNVKVWK